MSEPIDSVVVDAMAGAVERFPGDVALEVRREIVVAMLEAALRTGRVVPVRCSCPVGWGHVRDPEVRCAIRAYLMTQEPAPRSTAAGRPGCRVCGGGVCMTPETCARLAA